MADDRLRTTAEAATWLGITVGTLQEWVKAGKVRPTLKLAGRGYRWDLADLAEQLRQLAEGESVTDQPHRPSIVAAIVTSDLGVLITKRHDGKPLYGFVTGEQEIRETFAETAVREVREETGLEVTAGELIGERIHPATERHMVYLAASPASELAVTVGDPDELAEVSWLQLAEALPLLKGLYGPVRDYLTRTLDQS